MDIDENLDKHLEDIWDLANSCYRAGKHFVMYVCIWHFESKNQSLPRLFGFWKPRNDLQQLFHMIDIDESGTIEVSEFIGPLSRWAHDSKTAPRFIKYNMLQTMHLQQDLYDLSVDCFNHLSSRIDDVAHQICVVHGQSEAGEAKPDSKFQEAKYDDDLAKVLEASTAFPEPKPVSPVPRVSFQSELVSKPCEQFELTDFCIEAALLKIEVKLDALLAESREARAKTRTLGGLGRMQSQSFRSSPVESSLVQERRDVSRMRRLDTTAFRSLYMRSASMRSLAANREGSEANEGEECLAENVWDWNFLPWEDENQPKHGQMLNILLWFDYIIKRYKTDKTANIANRRHLTCMCFK